MFTQLGVSFCLVVLVGCSSEPACSQYHLLEQLLEKVVRMEFEVGQTKDNLAEVTNELAQLKEVKGRRELESVAFTAYLDNDVRNLAADAVIKFGAIELNEGGGYNNNTGIFTVPVSGVYMFSLSVEDYHNHRIWVKIVVDGQLKAHIVEWPGNRNNAQGSTTVAIRLQKDQRVWAAVDSRGSDNSLQGRADLRATSFTGVYLYP